MTSIADATERRTPYRGLTQFTERDARFFFGREEETRIIASNRRLAAHAALRADVGKLAAGGRRQAPPRPPRAPARTPWHPGLDHRLPDDRIAIGPRRDSWREDPSTLACAIQDAVAALDVAIIRHRAPDLVTLLAPGPSCSAPSCSWSSTSSRGSSSINNEDGEGTLAADLRACSPSRGWA
jgi:hypothetical protein